MFKQWMIRRALARTMKPDPEYRERMLAQFSPARQRRYWHNVRAALQPDID